MSLAGAWLQPAQAQLSRAPRLEAARDLSLQAATTFNNSYGTAFEATGNILGTATFSPGNITNPFTGNNSGIAFLSAMTSLDVGSTGILSAVSGVSGMVLTGGIAQFIVRDNSSIDLNSAPTPNIKPAPVLTGLTIGGGGSSSTVGASLVGTNVGTEVLQVSSGMSERIQNTLSAF